MRESIQFVFLFIQEISSFIFKLMYYIIYYYFNSLSMTDCNIIKNISRENIFQPPQKKKKNRKFWIYHWPYRYVLFNLCNVKKTKN
jgi:hypothetical protein